MHVVQHLSHRLAVNQLVDGVAFGIDRHMHGIRITKQIVHISQNLLISSDQKNRQIVVFLVAQRVQRQGGRIGTRADEIGNFAVRVASHILQGSLAVGSFIQPLYGHDGEHLVDSPGIGQ